MVYIYENHMGGLYYTNEPEDYDSLYCEQCGDSDWLKGTATTKQEIYDLFDGEIDDGNESGGWDAQYFNEFVNSIDFDN